MLLSKNTRLGEAPPTKGEVISPMRTDGSFHGSLTLAPLPTAWFLSLVNSGNYFPTVSGSTTNLVVLSPLALRKRQSRATPSEARTLRDEMNLKSLQMSDEPIFILPQTAQIDRCHSGWRGGVIICKRAPLVLLPEIGLLLFHLLQLAVVFGFSAFLGFELFRRCTC